MLTRLMILCGALVSTAALLTNAFACPFCAAVSQTFSQEIDSMDAAVIAKLVEAPEVTAEGAGVEATFEITQILKGKEHLGDTKTIKSLYYGEGRQGREFLILGTEPENMMWSTPTLLTDRGVKYINEVIKLPETGNDRYAFFQEHLEDKDEMLARDAYDEFANAPYSALHDLKPKMKHDQLVEWIENPDIAANRRRLYFTMLGVCGTKADLPLLEKMLNSDERVSKSGLDAMIGCYLTLAGADGLPLIEKRFLANQEAEYADTYAAIMALRFHGTETDIIEKDKLLKSLHLMLDRPALADLVIADFARWEDWSVIDKLVTLFKEADEETSWVRVPVIRYLMSCPKPEAKDHLVELEKIDPDAMKRAQTFFPFQSQAVPTRADGEKMQEENLLAMAEVDDNMLPPEQEDDEIQQPETSAPSGTPKTGEQTAMAKSHITRDELSTDGDRALAAAITGTNAPNIEETSTVGLFQRIFSTSIPIVVTFVLMLAISGILWNPGSKTSL
ncbi:hypothetical protein [Bremerella alba]|uniref:HEAT repeat domain-containing protein n=1 Tax=Bremerella alba TaxID=980252 RepID=A0A7V8V3N8_9BACT|nr:hypothetical protein [Bremerella alba]MBA2114315.1 hypothetical protein [Bremerella alba]